MSFGLFKLRGKKILSFSVLIALLVSSPYSYAEDKKSDVGEIERDIQYLEKEIDAELGSGPSAQPAQEEDLSMVDIVSTEMIEAASGEKNLSGTRNLSEFTQRVEARPKGTSDEKITLELKGVDVLDVLKILSKKSGLNIVAGKNVRGQVTMFLQDVDVWLALLTVLETSELAYVEEEGIVKVMTLKDYETTYGKPFDDRRITKTFELRYAKAVDVSTALSQLKSPLGTVIVDERSNAVIATDVPAAVTAMAQTINVVDKPNETRFFQLRYADAEDIESKISEIITPGTGTLKIDTRTNKVAVTDLPEKVQLIADIMHAFDSEPRQVLIEAKIIEVTLNDDFIFGIDWSLVLQAHKTRLERFAQFDTRAFGGITSPSDSPVTSPLSSLTASSDPGLNTLTINTTNDDFNGIISVLQGISKVNILSNPRITVLNKQEAKIAVATRQPFVSQTVVQATNTATTADNVEFVDVGVTMSVTPTITDTGYVLMQIKPEVSSAGAPLELQGAGQAATTSEALFTRTIVPVVTAQEAETTVLVKSGETVILGGLIQDKQADTRRKIPFLGDIPIVGAVFRNGGRDFSRSELVIFITPTVIAPEVTDPSATRFFDESGEIRNLNEVGGYRYEKGQFNSQDPFAINPKPYWRLDGVDSRKYFSAPDMYKDPNDPYANPKLVPKDELSLPAPSAASLEGYSQVVKERVKSAVRRQAELSTVGAINVILTVRSDGAIEEVSFANPKIQSDQALQQRFIQSVQKSAPFPEFPPSMSRPRESFNLTL